MLRALEEELANTLRTRSRADMERLLADEFVLRGSPDVDRATWMDEALRRCWGERFDIERFDTRAEESTALVSFVLTFHVHPDTCQPGTFRSLITDIWTRDAGAWRLRLRHASAVGDGVALQFAAVPDTPPRWVLLSELSFVSTAGNTSTTSAGAASDLTRQTAASSTQLRFAFITTEADEMTQARATTFQARHGITLRKQLEVFGRTAYLRDRFAGIDDRVSAEAGVAVKTGRPPRHSLTLESGVGFTAEERVAAATLRFATATGTARYRWQIAPGTDVRDELAVTADVTESRNWRAANAAALNVALTRLLSLKISNDFEYRNLPVLNFRRADVRTSAAVVVTLRAR